jgi:hypothetical protein
LPSHSILNSFDHLHFVSIASTSGIVLGNENVVEREVVDILLAKERAQTMLAEARMRREEERKNREKTLQVMNLECDEENVDLEEGSGTEVSHEERGSSGSS